MQPIPGLPPNPTADDLYRWQLAHGGAPGPLMPGTTLTIGSPTTPAGPSKGRTQALHNSLGGTPAGAERNQRVPFPDNPLPMQASPLPSGGDGQLTLDAHNPLANIPGATTGGGVGASVDQMNNYPGDASYGPLPGSAGSGNEAPGGLFSKFTPQDWLGVAGLGAGAIGAVANAKQQGKQFDQQMALQREQLAQNETQLNPYKQQGDLARLAMQRAMATGGPSMATFGSAAPTEGARPMFADAANKYLSDDALAGAKAGFDQKMSASQQALQQALQPPPDSGSGFWHKLGKVLSIAAPIAAAPFTGGATLAMIGAGAGAAGGALSGGGLKGALLGAGLGAIPMGGGLGKGAVAPGLSAGLKQAGKSIVTNPARALAVAGALR